MTDKQKALFNELTTLQQEISLNSLSGMNDIDSYKASSGKAVTVKAMEASVSQILGNLKVAAFIDEMKEAAVSDAVMSRREMLERLSNLARVNMSDLITFATIQAKNDDGQLIQQSTWQFKDSALQDDLTMASISEVSTTREGFKIKQHSPLSAMKQLADLEGYNAPTETHLTVESIDDFDDC